MDFALQNFQIDSVVVELGKFVCSLRHQLMNTTEESIVISKQIYTPRSLFWTVIWWRKTADKLASLRDY